MLYELKCQDRIVKGIFRCSTYVYGNNLLVEFIEVLPDGTLDPFCRLTVNTSLAPLPPYFAFFDINNIGTEVYEQLLADKILEQMGYAQSGYVLYPLVRFDPNLLNVFGSDLEEVL